jgi:hypothetical protein
VVGPAIEEALETEAAADPDAPDAVPGSPLAEPLLDPAV